MTETEQFFHYRAWSISVWEDWDFFERNLNRALVEAPRHNINCIELQDYVMSFIDMPARFDNYPRLAGTDPLTYRCRGKGPTAMTRRDRAAATARLRDMACKVKEAGYELQVWYHCFRDLPMETFDLHPELRAPDGTALYEFMADCLRDAFAAIPEIDGLTVTSLCEVPRLLSDADGGTPVDRITRLFRSLSNTCEEHGKRLILRDFIVRKDEFDSFDRVVDELPDSVVLQTKNVVADWGGHEKPVNHYITRYARKSKRLVVEFELANNFTGETEIPWCDPEQIWRHIRHMAELGVWGGVGRLVNADTLTAGTIFDTPNEVNVWAFSRLLADPGRMLTAREDTWDRSYEQFDMSIWRDWADYRFGKSAAVHVIQLLRETPKLCNLAFNMCGAHCLWSNNSGADKEEFKKSMLGPTRNVPAAIRAVERCGHDLARAEKTEAMRMIRDGLAVVERLRPVLSNAAFANLHGAYKRALYLVGIFQTATEAFLAALEVEAGTAGREELTRATDALRSAGAAASDEFYPGLLHGTAGNAAFMAEFFDEMPGRAAQYRTMNA